MRAIVFVTGQSDGGLFEGDRNSVSLMWLVDRPVIQRICEGLVVHGVKTIDWVHQHANEKTVHLLGDGRRWGVRFRHEYVEPGTSVYSAARNLFSSVDDGNAVLVGHANRFFDFSALTEKELGDVSARLYDLAGQGIAWTGWSLLSKQAGSAIPNSISSPSDFERYLTSGGAGTFHRELLSRGYAVHSVDTYLRATREILSTEFPDGHNRLPRSARVHRTARLVGPVCVGAGADIGANAVIGPNVVVGPNSIIDRNAVVANSVILPFSYVARDLRLNQAVVDRNRVLGPASGGHALVDDRAPVACLSTRPFPRIRPSAIAGGTVGLLHRFGSLPSRIFRKRTSDSVRPLANVSVIPAGAN